MMCLYPFDDGPYVLGALSPAERAEYERHLSTCPSCRESVAALAVLPGLLSRLDPATVVPHPVTAPPTLLPRILAVVATRRRAQRLRRRWFAVAASVVVLLLSSAVGVGVRVAMSVPSASTVAPVLFTAMRPAGPIADNIPMNAKIGLARTGGGTMVYMECRYDSAFSQQWQLALVVYPRDAGAGQRLGVWTPESDQDWTLRSPTPLAPEQIGRIEMQRSDGKPLFVWWPA